MHQPERRFHHSRRRRLGWTLATVLVAAWLAVPSAAVADPPEGAGLPALAAQRLVQALATGNSDAALAIMTNELELEWGPKIDALIDAMTIETRLLVQAHQRNGWASARFEWECRFSTQVYREGVEARIRLEMEEQGMDEAQIQQVLKAMEADLVAEANQLREHFERDELEIELTRQDDRRWYVSEFARELMGPGGGTSAEAVARRMLEAWRDAPSDRHAVLDNFSELARERFLATDGDALIASLRVESFELGTAQSLDESEREAEILVKWEARLDTQRYVRTMLAVIRRELIAQGFAGDDLEKEMELIRDEIEHEAHGVRSAFERREQTMRLERVGDGDASRWYVDRLIDDSTPDGTADPLDAAYTLLVDGLEFNDVRRAGYVIAPPQRAEQRTLDGLEWIRALTLESKQVGEIEHGEDGDTATLRVSWRASFNEETYLRAARNAQIERMRREGYDAEQIQRRLAESRDDRERRASELTTLAEANEITIHLTRTNERWYVERLEPHTDD